MDALKKSVSFCKNIVSWIIDVCTCTYSNRIYVRPMQNSYIDKYDIINNGSDNLLKFIYAYVREPHTKKITIYMEYGDPERYKEYQSFAKMVSSNNVVLHFLNDPALESSTTMYLLRRFINACYRMKCKVWLNGSGDYHRRHSTKKHTEICMNYFISCKNDLIPGENDRWKDLDYIVTTALLPSQILAASFGVRQDHCLMVGFPRNDTILESDRKDSVMQWIISNTGYVPKHIFLYVPTFRDYEKETGAQRPILGYEFDNLGDILKNSQSVLIYKMHPLDKANLLEDSSFLEYKKCYDFSLYDVMAVADCLIGDYSSVSFDFLIRNKPIIFNLYDLQKYSELRGLSYDPFESFCGGAVVSNKMEMENAILDILENRDRYAEKRKFVSNLMHKHSDSLSTERFVRFFDQLMGEI